jgi:hypothetical protein
MPRQVHLSLEVGRQVKERLLELAQHMAEETGRRVGMTEIAVRLINIAWNALKNGKDPWRIG